jgi:hypothetical protein
MPTAVSHNQLWRAPSQLMPGRAQRRQRTGFSASSALRLRRAGLSGFQGNEVVQVLQARQACCPSPRRSPWRFSTSARTSRSSALQGLCLCVHLLLLLCQQEPPCVSAGSLHGPGLLLLHHLSGFEESLMRLWPEAVYVRHGSTRLTHIDLGLSEP